MRKALPFLCALSFAGLAIPSESPAQLAPDAGLQAGAAALNIDPPVLPVIRNGGFTQGIEKSVHQSLYARSLVLANGTERIAICIVDTCMIDRELCDRAKTLVAGETGIPEDRILLSATHTHTAPSAMRCLGCPVDPHYPGFLVPKIAESIALAAANLRPAAAGWTVADAGLYTNTRRWIYLPHAIGTDPYGKKTIRAMMHPGYANPNTAGPSGPEDPDLTLLSVRDRDGRPLAVLGNLSQHYFADGSLSSGYTGTFCKLLEEEFGEPFVGLMSQGTSGDLQHMDYSLPAKDQVFPREGDGYQRYCRGLADLALEALKKIDHRADCELAMAETKLTLGRRLPDAERIAWAKPIVEKLGDRLPGDRPEVLAKEVFWLLENPEAELKLQALRIGDFGIATFPNEVYGITGLKLKMQSPLRPTMNIELANGAEGYIPPPEQHHLGGYTTWPARTAGLEVQAEPKITATLLGLLEKISGSPRREPAGAIRAHGRAILELRPKAWWRMSAHSGDRIPDAGGAGNDARLEPGYALFLPGPEGEHLASTERGNRAVHFAGGRLVADKTAPSGDFSVSLWFWNAMPDDARPVTGYLFSTGDEKASTGDHLGIGGTALKGSQGKIFLYNGDRDREIAIGKTGLEPRRWHHLILARSGDTVRVFLDGDLEIEASFPDARPSGSRLFIGGRGDRFAGFEGKIDEVALFDRALDDDEIASITSSADAAKPQLDGTSRSPNVLFIGVDDLRPELNCYGAGHIVSPNIDRLAAEGVLFERAYCQWAVCMPSRASLLSGLRPDTFNGKADAFRRIVPDVVTLPQHFKNHGYFAQSFGKVYHGSWKTAYVGNSFQDPVSWSEERWAASPQYYFSPEGMAAAREVFATASPKSLFLGDAKRDPDDPDQWKNFFVRGPATEAPEVPDDVPADGAIAGAALDRLRELNAGKDHPPFFLAVGFQKPHLPFVAPKKYWDLYDPEKIPPVAVPDPPEGAPGFAVDVGAAELNQYLEKTTGRVPAARTRHLRHGYAACVSYVDAQIGRLLDELDALGIRDDTIVVLWSDHGYKLGDFGSWAKHTNFELDTRVPLIVSAPGLARGERCGALVELVDLHPTLSELAGLPIHPGAEGESFAGNVKDPGAAGQDVAFSQFPKGGYMGYTVRTATHRYTEWRNTKVKNEEAEVCELYEYGEGGIERVNLADRLEYADLQARLRQRLEGCFPSPGKGATR